MLWFFLVIIVMALVVETSNGLKKGRQQVRGHDRCEACKSRLKAVNGRYATTCRKCAHQQSWVAN